MWKGFDLVGFGNGIVDPVCEGGAYVATGKVEVGTKVAKVGDDLKGSVDVVPQEATKCVSGVVASGKRKDLWLATMLPRSSM